MADFQLEIIARTGASHVPTLESYLPRAHRLLKSQLSELSVALVGEARMAALHKQYMGITGPTDVLTFPLDHDSKNRVISGEVVICVPYAARQAERRGIPVSREIVLYAIHGLLHLSGFDDTTETAFRKMHAMEDTILTRLGLEPVFAVEPTSSPRRRINKRAATTRAPGA